MKQLKVSIVIPNWNGAKLLAAHLPKVLAAARGSEVIVVDDHSTDNSVPFLKDKFPEVRVIVKETNSGFAQTVNMGVAKAKGDVVVLLNSDVAPETGFLAALLKHFSDPMVFAVGCLEKNPETEGTVLRGRAVAHWWRGLYVHNKGETDKPDTAWASGGSSAFRKGLWDRLGGMDEIYNPFYWEDIDLSYRAMKAGFTVLFEPKAVVWHFHQKGAIKTQFEKERVDQIAFRNQFIFIWKNLTDADIWLAHILWTPVRITQQLVSGKTALLVGFMMALGKLPPIFRSRRILRVLWKKKDRDIAVY